MPNHITNKVSAPAHVLTSLINGDGRIDFGKLIKFEGEFTWDFICGAAETAAEAAINLPLSNNPMLAGMQRHSRETSSVTKLSDESFEQFVQMLRNHRKTGYMHCMDFARHAWGTKWNAYSQKIDVEGCSLSFDTAWNAPVPVFKALSALHPTEEITVVFAAEDLGSNCGTLKLKGGALVEQDCAGPWNKMTEAQQDKWRDFARGVTGRTDDEE
ncbi:hypothetical protein PAGU2196_11040 [Pseudomonas sp. PAGU 2196]|uniref:DUF1281 family ferredoxin-like fold protein n=1 Tax=Pseudomonas sp. PAGU 2196 TaxID=2793997 RepID=UPI001EDF6467|nr:hypothetical protein [Pseudomonas sp. PAGU 2196]GHS80270.1 hypothetical protein PAGU2196_11040 [Pseudomonas sp. PAGU 2196]